MNRKPLVSVIIPVYNGAMYLRDALESVFEQDYRNFEVIVVDDGSSDASGSIAGSFPGIRYISQTNQGIAVANNAGITASKGTFVAFMDADDLWAPNKLTVQMQCFLDDPEIGYVLSNKRVFLEEGRSKPGWLKSTILNDITIGFLPGALVARKSLFETVGRYNPAYEISSDADWFFRAEDAGIKKVIVPQVLLYKRIHDSNQTHQTKTIHEELLKIAMSSIKGKHRKNERK